MEQTIQRLESLEQMVDRLEGLEKRIEGLEKRIGCLEGMGHLTDPLDGMQQMSERLEDMEQRTEHLEDDYQALHQIMLPKRLLNSHEDTLKTLQSQVAALISGQYYIRQCLKTCPFPLSRAASGQAGSTLGASNMAMEVVTQQLLMELQDHVKELENAKVALLEALAAHLTLPLRMDALAASVEKSKREARGVQQTVVKMGKAILALKRDAAFMKEKKSQPK